MACSNFDHILKNSTIRIVILLGVLAFLGMAAIQAFWISKAFDQQDKQFNHNVHLALRSVAEEILRLNDHQIPFVSPVNQLSANYFVVMINDRIDVRLLEELLRREFEKRSLHINFEYGVYDCQSERMLYGNYVSFDEPEQPEKKTELPVWNRENYYFGVFFPDKASHLTAELGIWLFSTGAMLVVFLFFSYALFIILRQKRLSEIQKDFINNLTHEFKTPVSTILVSTELLRHPALQGDRAQWLHYTTVIQQEANRIRGHVERVLQVAALDRRSLDLERIPVDLHQAVHEAIQSLHLLVDQRHGQITFLPEATQSVVTGDRHHLIGVVYNLLENALKYCDAAPHIRVSTASDRKGIRLTVQDNGIGIAPGHLRQIFEKFYRVPTGNLHNVKGFGLGLSYVRSIVQAHHGKIHVSSQPGQGSAFEIWLPLQK